MRRSWLLAIALSGTGCADAPPAWPGIIRDSAGVAIIENPAVPLSPVAPEIREVLRIGSADGPRETQFGLIASMAVAADGTLYVLDQANQSVRVFDAAGKFLRELGSPGGGPGELSAFAVAVMLAHDTVIVADPGNSRFSLFLPDGTSAGGFRMPAPAGTAPQRFALLPDGGILEMARTTPTPAHPELRDDVLVVVDRTGAIRDTLHRMPTSQSIRFRGEAVQFAAYHAEPIWALDAEGRLFSSMSGRYRIEVRDATGTLQRVITRAHVRQPITESDRQAFLRMLRRTLREQGTDPALIEQMVGGMSFADSYPVFAHFLPGPEGSLWVQHVRTAADAAAEGREFDAADVGAETWDVFDAAGRLIAIARLPARFTPLVSAGTRFYGIWRDDLDVQHVRVLDIALPEIDDR